MRLTRKQLKRLIEQMLHEDQGTHKAAIRMAKMLHDAIDGMGTNEDDIGEVFTEIGTTDDPPSTLKKVAGLYKKMYKAPLSTDLIDDLSQEELFTVIDANFKGGLDILLDMELENAMKKQDSVTDVVLSKITKYAQQAGKKSANWAKAAAQSATDG